MRRYVSAVIVTAATAEPVSLNKAKEFLRVTGTDDNDKITDLTRSVRTMAENLMGVKLMTQTWKAYYNEFPDDDNTFEIPFPPLKDITHIKYTDSTGGSTTIATTIYAFDTVASPGRITLKTDQEWPTDELYPVNPIEIQFVCGYGTSATAIPEDLLTVIKVGVERIYNRPDESYDRVLKSVFRDMCLNRSLSAGVYRP